MSDELYKENIIDHYSHPRNQGTVERATHQAREVNPLCGDELTFSLEVDGKQIKEVKFTGKGCAISMASASLLSEILAGKAVAEVNKLKKADVFALLGIPISHAREKCALLSLHTVQVALEEK